MALLVASACLLSFGQNQTHDHVGPEAQVGVYVPVHKFDPKRDAAADIEAAIHEAQRTGKRILLDVGGDWCSWCHVLDTFLEKHPEIVELRDSNFITVNVFYSSENKNEKVLSKYPKTATIPHFFVLDRDGTLLCSQAMVTLEVGGEPNAQKWKEFLSEWSPTHVQNLTKVV